MSSIWFLVNAGYTHGEQNMRTNIGGLGEGFYSMIARWMDNATQVSGIELFFLVAGGLLDLLGIAGRSVFPWWPLHPIGFVVETSGLVRGVVFSIFLAWTLERLAFLFGGVGKYQRMKPFFLGMLVGYVPGAGLSYLVDGVWFPDRLHSFEVFF